MQIMFNDIISFFLDVIKNKMLFFGKLNFA